MVSRDMLDSVRGLCVVGCGTMGEAITRGLLDAGQIEAAQICVTARHTKRLEALADNLGVRTQRDNLAAIRDADVVLLCVKPQHFAELLEPPEMAEATAGKLVISIAAGIELERLAGWLPKAKLVRAMPNTSARIGRGMTVVTRAEGVTDEELSIAESIFSAVGQVLELDNKHMNAVTSLNGSGPAFAYVMLEAMADGGVMMGLPRDAALKIAARVFSGAAAMVEETSLHPAALKDQVTTPAGCTIAGLLTMEDGRIRSVLARTIQEATRVAAGLGDDSSGDEPPKR